MTTMTAAHNQNAYTAALAVMDHDTFTTFVGKSLGRDADPALWDALTGEDLITRTREVLGWIRSDMQDQLTQRNAELDQVKAACIEMGDPGKERFAQARAAQSDWRHRLAGYKRLLDYRIAFVRSRTPAPVRQQHMPYGAGGTKTARKHNREALENLTRAVAEHRRRVESGDGDEGDDEKLWDCLTSVTAITRDGGELPLAEWLEYLDDVRDEDE